MVQEGETAQDIRLALLHSVQKADAIGNRVPRFLRSHRSESTKSVSWDRDGFLIWQICGMDLVMVYVAR